MDEEKARRILKGWIQPDNGLHCLGTYIAWTPGNGEEACLDGTFSAEELEAVVWWMVHFEGQDSQ